LWNRLLGMDFVFGLVGNIFFVFQQKEQYDYGSKSPSQLLVLSERGGNFNLLINKFPKSDRDIT
jgi:hypothetical protein